MQQAGESIAEDYNYAKVFKKMIRWWGRLNLLRYEWYLYLIEVVEEEQFELLEGVYVSAEHADCH